MNLVKIESVTPAVIKWDEKAIKDTVSKAVKEYSDKVSAATEPEDFKAIQVELNKSVKDVEEKAKTIDKELSAPIKEFRKFIKEQVAQFDDVRALCKSELSKVEEQQKAEKLEAITQIEGYDFFINFMDVDEKWLNKSTTIKSIKEQIEIANEQLKANVKTIEVTAKSHDMKLSRVKDYIEMLKHYAIDEIVNRIMEDAKMVREAKEKPEPIKVEGDMIKTNITFTARKSQLNAMIQFCKDNGIEYVVESKEVI